MSICCSQISYFFMTLKPLSGLGAPHYRSFTITLRHTTFGRTPPDEWSLRSRDLYLTTHYTQNRLTFIPLMGFEPVVLASELPQTHTLDGAVIGNGTKIHILTRKWIPESEASSQRLITLHNPEHIYVAGCVVLIISSHGYAKKFKSPLVKSTRCEYIFRCHVKGLQHTALFDKALHFEWHITLFSGLFL